MKASDLPVYYNAANILERNLIERPDKIALLSSQEEMTFREVNRQANQVANALTRLGIHGGDFVGLLSPDLPEWVTTFFGIWKIGGVAIGINTFLETADYDYILRDSYARLLIAHESLLDRILPVLDSLPFLQKIIVIGKEIPERFTSYDDWVTDEPVEFETVTTHREDFCTLNYSSGTTGKPKGILHAHKDYPLTTKIWATNIIGLTESDRTIAIPKLFFTFGLISNLTSPWDLGASIVLLERHARHTGDVLASIDRFKASVLFGVPTAYSMLLATEGFDENYDLSSLRLCYTAGEALPAPLWESWKERTGLDLIEGIGTTENLTLFISNTSQDFKPGSSGKIVPGYEARLVDEEGQPVQPGETGDLHIRGETASFFYLHQYEKSKTAFQGEWLITGDKYIVDEDGFYWHQGREDDLLKVGGIWVSPLEVESTLISHPAVLQCAVVGHPDSANLIKPKAFVILDNDFQPTDELANELIQYCRANMAAFKRPRWIEFLDELPKTSTGKIQRAKLREPSHSPG